MADSIPQCEPLFIVGYPRSGTTLILDLLKTAEFPSHVNETHFYSHHYRRYGSLKKTSSRQRFLTAMGNTDWLRSAPFSLQAVRDLWEERGDLSYGCFFGAFMDLLAYSHGSRRWLEKTPWHSKYLDVIRSDFPEARFIHIVRDPRDVVLSVWKNEWIRLGWVSFAQFSLSWRWMVSRALKFQAAHHTMARTFSFEDLVTKPDVVVCELNGWLGLSLDLDHIFSQSSGVLRNPNSSHADLTSSEGLSTRPVGRWRRSLEIRQVEVVDELAGDVMRELGYEPRMSSGLARSLRGPLRLAYGLQKQLKAVAFPITRR